MRAAHLLSLGLSLASLATAQTVAWSQVGGTLVKSTTIAGIAGQGYETALAQGEGAQVQSGFLAHPLLRTSAPFVVAPIANRNVNPGFTPIRIALKDVFADLDGDALTFQQSAAGASVSAQISHDTLVVSGVADGSGATQLTVTASDGSNLGTTSFQVYVQTDVAIRAPGHVRKLDGDLDARVPRVFAQVARGTAQGRLGAGSDCCNGNCLTTEILLPGPASVAVSIFDNAGTPVIAWSDDIQARTLSGIVPGEDGRRPVAVTWNLRSSDGQPVSAGVYLWKIVARTPDGRKLETVRRLGVKKAD